MKVADFFIQLGITGNVKTKEAISGIHTSLKSVRDTSIETKAGILGAFYALEEMTSGAIKAAASLRDFAGDTGYSTDQLQRWQYIAEINGVKADTLADSLKHLQMVQAEMRLGGAVNPATTYFQLNNLQDKFEMLKSIHEKLKSLGNDTGKIGEARLMVERLGLGSMFSMLRTGDLSGAGFTKTMAMERDEYEKNLKLGKEWTKLRMTLEGARNKLVANELSTPIGDFLKSMKGGIEEALVLIGKLDKALKVFSPKNSGQIKEWALGIGAGLAVLSATGPFGPVILTILGLAAALSKLEEFNSKKPEDAKSGLADTDSLFGGGFADRLTNHKMDMLRSATSDISDFLAGQFGGTQMGPPAPANVTVTNHNTFDAADLPDAAKEFYKQLSSTVHQSPFLNSLQKPKGTQ